MIDKIKPKNGTSKKVTFIVVALNILLFTPVVIFLIIYITTSINARNANAARISNIPKEVTAAYEANKGTFNAHDSYENDLVNSGAVGAKIGETQTSVCYFRSSGPGFTVTAYYQDCYLRVTVGYHTSLSEGGVLAKLQLTSNASMYVSNPDNIDPCMLSANGPVAVGYVSAHTLPSTLDNIGILHYVKCGQPSSVQGPTSSERSLGTDMSIKYLKTIDESTVDRNSNQVWIDADYQYYEQQVPCKTAVFSLFGNCDLWSNKPVQ